MNKIVKFDPEFPVIYIINLAQKIYISRGPLGRTIAPTALMIEIYTETINEKVFQKATEKFKK